MKELTCIVCPNGCRIRIEKAGGDYLVTGNSCNRGRAYAVSEITQPTRTLCTTVRTGFKYAPALPVRTSAPIPKDKIFDAVRALASVCVCESKRAGDIILPDILGLGSDIICTSNILADDT